MMGRRILYFLASCCVAAAIVLIWKLVSDFRLVSPIFLPPPERAWAALVFNVQRGGLLTYVLLTVKHMVLAWLLASLAGIAIGAAIGISATARRYLAPTLEFFRPLPASTLFPVAIALFGLTEGMLLSVIAFGALWPTLLATVNGFAHVKPRLQEVARLLGLSRMQFVLRIALPNAMPEVLAGMRLSLTIALILSVTGEMVSGSDGLGRWILLQARGFRSADVFAGVLLFGVIGYVSAQAISLAESRLLRWRTFH
jgi:ABC-type nitrate/sulfonate/bicarbonate transport system permease component